MQWVAVGILFLFLLVLCSILGCMNTVCFTQAHAANFLPQRHVLELKEITNAARFLYWRYAFKGHRWRRKLEVSVLSAPASTGLPASTNSGCGSLPVTQSKYQHILNSVQSQTPALKSSRWGLWLSTDRRSQLVDPGGQSSGKGPPDLVPPEKGLWEEEATCCFLFPRITEMEKASQFSSVLPLHRTARCFNVEHLTPVGEGFDCSDLPELEFVS